MERGFRGAGESWFAPALDRATRWTIRLGGDLVTRYEVYVCPSA